MANTECPAASPRGERAANDRTFAANPDSEWSSMDLTTLSMEAVEPDGGACHGRGSQGPGWQATGSGGHDRASPPPRVIGNTLGGLGVETQQCEIG
ncbi:MAG: hypothetical protein ACYS7Y_32690 [Planctomycetota bacterium]